MSENGGVTGMPNIADPSQWSDPHGAVICWAIVALIIVGCALRLVSGQWSDWLDERWGRGSIRDWWLLKDRDNGTDSRR